MRQQTKLWRIPYVGHPVLDKLDYYNSPHAHYDIINISIVIEETFPWQIIHSPFREYGVYYLEMPDA